MIKIDFARMDVKGKTIHYRMYTDAELSGKGVTKLEGSERTLYYMEENRHVKCTMYKLTHAAFESIKKDVLSVLI